MGAGNVVVGLAVVGLGMPAMPGRIPGDRLIATRTKRRTKEPNSGEVIYAIGRTHYAMFSRAVESEWLKQGEVVPIEQTTISALRTKFDSRAGESFVSSQGLRLKDGRMLPT